MKVIGADFSERTIYSREAYFAVGDFNFLGFFYIIGML